MVEKHLLLGLLWILFCGLHSILAELRIKKWMSAHLGNGFKYYRLFYTVFAFVTLGIVVYYGVTLPSPLLYSKSMLSTVIGGVVALSGVIVMGICIKKYFISLSGLKSLFQDNLTNTLMIGGIHEFVRHPLYAGTFMAIWGVFIVYPFLSLLISNLIITLYTLIGIELEEKKLEKEFGLDYINYKQKVPKLFPALRMINNKHLSSPK